MQFYVSLFSVFTLFYLILENMPSNVRKFVFLGIFNTCDVVYNWFISLLPPNVLNNLFDQNLFFLTFAILNMIFCQTITKLSFRTSAYVFVEFFVFALTAPFHFMIM